MNTNAQRKPKALVNPYLDEFNAIKDRLEALKKFTDLHLLGLEKAGTVRDRISSRRAEGKEIRATGRSSWRWTV